MAPGAAILAPEGPELSSWEAGFFADFDPWGFILFARNIEGPDQLRRLTAALRDTVGRDAPILIDQEGGRVARMGPPHWRSFLPPLDQMARARDPARAMWVRYRLIAAELRAAGIDANCAPVGDVATDHTHPFLKNRTYGTDPETVVKAARAVAEGLLAGGVLPVLKHIPGHGRARADSHLEMPRVSAVRAALDAVDFAVFRALSDLPMGMTAHLSYDAIAPGVPATFSPAMIALIRDEIGFGGLLMTDDIGMEALGGPVGARGRRALEAGCDLVLHCSGRRAEMEDLAREIGPMTPEAEARGRAALAWRRPPEPADLAALDAELAALLG